MLPLAELFTVKWDNVAHHWKKKARIVVRGDLERDINTQDLYSPVANYDTIRLFVALHGLFGFQLRQADISCAYLHGNRKKETFLELPSGHPDRIGRRRVWKTTSSIYGLRDAPLRWNETINRELEDFGFKRSQTDSCLYVKGSGDQRMYLCLYVDDLIYMSRMGDQLDRLESFLERKFKVKTTHFVNQYVGFEVEKQPTGLKMHCRRYIEKLVEVYGLVNARGAVVPLTRSTFQTGTAVQSPQLPDKRPYQSIVGALAYVGHLCRPDISYAVNFLSRHNTCPTAHLLRLAKQVVVYLRGTSRLGLTFQRQLQDQKLQLQAYCDSDWAQEKKTAKV